MKVSTILKAVAAVAAIGTVGAVVYSKTKAEKEIKMAENIEDVVELDEAESDEKTNSGLSSFTAKEKIATVLSGTLCGLTGGLITYMIMVPVTHAIADHVLVYKLVRKAIDNNNLTVEELIDLAYETCQEVA